MPSLYLASHSPRRRELLQQIGVAFTLLPTIDADGPRVDTVDETRRARESPAAYVERVAVAKAIAGRAVILRPGGLPAPVLAADTVVIVDDEVLGKPRTRDEAAGYLRLLSGRTHEVRTVVSLAPAAPGADNHHAPLVATSVSEVRFRTLGADEIARYCALDEPYDKAGGYAVQGKAAVFIEHLCGSYSGVMGLPLAQTATLLACVGIRAV